MSKELEFNTLQMQQLVHYLKIIQGNLSKLKWLIYGDGGGNKMLQLKLQYKIQLKMVNYSL